MNQDLRIPFEHLGRTGIAKFIYRQNSGSAGSGLETIPGINFAFDLDLCMLYPTLYATVDEYEGTGIRCSMAWLQLIISRHWMRGEEHPRTGVGVDMADDFKKLGVPFYSYGSNPSLYDCPCYNLSDSEEKLEFIAETYLVTHPGRWNNNTVSFLAGARWGYEEYDINKTRNVNILPIEALSGAAWNKHVSLLREQFATWKYGEYTERKMSDSSHPSPSPPKSSMKQ